MNQFNRSDKFEEHILKNVGGFVYLECCALGIDPINVYHKRKELENEGKKILCVTGNNTEFGYLATFVLEDMESDEPITTVEQALDKPVFAYVLNLHNPDCSEYGFVQITKDKDRGVRRIY